MSLQPEQPSLPPHGSESSEASTIEDSENGQPLTTATTPENITVSTKVQDDDKEMAVETEPVKTEFLKIPTAPTSLANSELPEGSDKNESSLPKVSWDDNIDVDELSDEDRDIVRIQKAPKQVSQIVQYTKLMEERVQVLEREVNRLKDIANKTVGSNAIRSPFPDLGGPEAVKEDILGTCPIPMLIPNIQRVFWADYDSSRATHSIDVVYGYLDDTFNKEQHMPRNDEKHGYAANKSLNKAANKVAIPIPGQDGRPTRICIQSRLLRTELKKLTEYDIMYESREILPPYKPFVLNESKIRKHLARLEEGLSELKQDEAALINAALSQGSAESVSNIPLSPLTEERIVKEQTEEPKAKPEIEATEGITDPSPTMDENLEPKMAVKSVERPVFPTQVPHGDESLTVNPQDLGCLMVGCQKSREIALTELTILGTYDAAYGTLSLLIPANEEDEAARQLAVFEAYTLLEEWKTLIHVLDNDLADVFAIRKQIKNQELESIAFEDLSHLFEPGDMVYDSSGTSLQLLRVLSSTGGRRILDTGTSADLTAQPVEAPMWDQQAVTIAFGNLVHMMSKFSPFVIDCYHLDFDGYHFGPVQKTIPINKYDGLQSIASLPLSPAWFGKKKKETQNGAAAETTNEAFAEEDAADKKEKTKDPWLAILDRGKKFARLCDLSQVVHRQYCGLSLDDPPEEVDSKVIIDFKMASLVPEDERPRGTDWVPKLELTGPSKSDEREVKGPVTGKICSIPNCPVCPPGKRTLALLNDQKTSAQQSREFIMSCPILVERSMKAKQKLEDDDFRLMPYRLFGFVLRNRKWTRLHIENVKKITREENNFSRLVLPRGYADIVQALVETHTKTNKASKETTKYGAHEVDLVRGKGKGLIILLHGAPGVGKTSTAECVAEHTRRPLFPITCGDIGDTAEAVEKNLERCFQLAHKWGCVLLLDEADVFLTERGKTDLQRNALVSVFLRVLEYYAGILFLTTNRVGTFDEAFKSRIHMSLGYPPLGRNQTEKIWRMNLERTKEAKDLDLKIDSDAIMDFADQHWEDSQEDNGGGAWNGRQIRNAFQTAIALAKWDYEQKKVAKPVLDDTHFKKVAEASTQFDAYLKVVHGGSTEADRALEANKRADEFVPGKKEKISTLNAAKFGKKSNDSRLRSNEGETPQKKKKKTLAKAISEDEETPSRKRKTPRKVESEEEVDPQAKSSKKKSVEVDESEEEITHAGNVSEEESED